MPRLQWNTHPRRAVGTGPDDPDFWEGDPYDPDFWQTDDDCPACDGRGDPGCLTCGGEGYL
jgi:hypothetical protein